MTEDEKLIYNIKRKRREAFENVIKRYTPYVSTVIYNMAGTSITKEDVEEITLDTFLSLWHNANAFDSQKGNIRIYLGTIARNLAIDRLRKFRESMVLDENIITTQDDPYQKVEQKEERKAMIQLIHELGEPDSEIFMRYYYYDEKISHISNIMGIKCSTIKTKLARGRKRLKEILERRDSDE